MGGHQVNVTILVLFGFFFKERKKQKKMKKKSIPNCFLHPFLPSVFYSR